MLTSQKLWAVIPVAGSGSRFSSQQLKQYMLIDDKTVLEHTLEAITQLPLSAYVLAKSPNDQQLAQLNLPSAHLAHVCLGGAERVNSVLNGLYYLKNQCHAHDDDWVMVHDAARPCVQYQHLNALYQQCLNTGQSAILATPVRDTLKKADTAQKILHTVNREQMWQAQTPQMVQLGVLIQAIECALANGVTITDEASALEYIGEVVHLVQGSSDNLKITYADDLRLAKLILQARTATL